LLLVFVLEILCFSFPAPVGSLEHSLNNFGLLNLYWAPLFTLLVTTSNQHGRIKQKSINIDFPIVLGLVVLFIRSSFEIITNTGVGFIDSMTGLIFFLLLGKIFHSKTYDALNFERNYKSYFPVSVTLKRSGKETSIPVSNLKNGDRILIRNNELIPLMPFYSTVTLT
jgi:Cu+-exporting ATPase